MTQAVELSKNSLIQEIDDLNAMGKYMVENKLVPSGIKPHEISLIVNTGKTLGMDPITSVNSIDIVQGNLSLKAKIIPALLAKKGVHVDVIKDFEPVIEKIKVPMKDPETKEILKNEDGSIKFYKDEEGNYIKKDKILDYVTEVEFLRHIPGIGITKRRCSFKWSMAEAAGWTNKANWQNMPAYMMMARAISRGARLYASDAINGMYDNYEMMDAFVDDNDMKNMPVTEDGELLYDHGYNDPDENSTQTKLS